MTISLLRRIEALEEGGLHSADPVERFKAQASAIMAAIYAGRPTDGFDPAIVAHVRLYLSDPEAYEQAARDAH